MPAPHNTPQFTNFNQYLDANSGSLDQERAGLVGAVDAAGQKAQTDLAAVNPAAMAQSQAQYEAEAPGYVNIPLNSPGSYQGAPTIDPTTTPEFATFTADRQSALDALSNATGPSTKYGVREASMLGANADYQGQVTGLKQKYGGALDTYFDSLAPQTYGGPPAYSGPDPAEPPLDRPDATPVESGGGQGPDVTPQYGGGYAGKPSGRRPIDRTGKYGEEP